ncbi:hemolysin D [Thermaurantimonas aggregans]|uniref:Hemolysin D n=1 Tax=Thermaurantimonas aggregans TaxID=2173829 RepID=A0A401XIS4_9FLAO|nr:efflux RND transporter periplasmic adaptor subunit [Thermaurantimonas aggregans]GCD76906.1 hemolysin D [Thermaurantimonas aggregans]
MRKILNLAIVLSIFISSCHHKEEHGDQNVKFVATSPIKTDTTVFREYVCQIHSIQHIELRALEKSYLQNIYVDEGQFVKKGQMLFQIMPVIYRAEVQRAQAEVDFAAIEYNNTKALADSHVVSPNELALAKAKYEKAKSELALAKAHLSFTEIRAPFDGLIGTFNDVRIGSLLDEGELLTTLSDNSKMWVYFNVPEAEYLNYALQKRQDKPLKVLLRMANDQLYDQEGVIETIESDFNSETGNIAFRATFQNPNRILRHGQTGNILMPVPLKNVLLIPQKATYEVLDKTYVYVINNNNQIEAREIKIGAELPHLFVVREGLSEKDKILVEGLRKVKNKQKIRYEFEPLSKIISELHSIHAE